MASRLDQLDQLLSQQEKTMQSAFREFVRAINSQTVLDEIVALLETGDLNGALAIVDSYATRFANVLSVIQQTVGIATANELAEQAGGLAVGIGFDPTNPRAAALARANRMTLIREFTTEQRRATRQAIARALADGTSGPAGIARAFRQSIGLTATQEGWVSSFDQRLRDLDRRALLMDLRDARFDGTIAEAIRAGTPLTERQITTMVDRYRARALMMRSETIAQTESLRATSMAREEATRQMAEQTGIASARIVRVWNATLDARTRDWHASMDQQRVGMDEAFEDGLGNRLMWPGDPAAPPETTINCRCTVTYDIASALDEQAA